MHLWISDIYQMVIILYEQVIDMKYMIQESFVLVRKVFIMPPWGYIKKYLTTKKLYNSWDLSNMYKKPLHHFISHFYSLSFFKKRNNRILIEFFVCLPTNHLPLKRHFLLRPTYLIPLEPFSYPYNDLFFHALILSSHVLFSMSIASMHL